MGTPWGRFLIQVRSSSFQRCRIRMLFCVFSSLSSCVCHTGSWERQHPLPQTKQQIQQESKTFYHEQTQMAVRMPGKGRERAGEKRNATQLSPSPERLSPLVLLPIFHTGDPPHSTSSLLAGFALTLEPRVLWGGKGLHPGSWGA